MCPTDRFWTWKCSLAADNIENKKGAVLRITYKNEAMVLAKIYMKKIKRPVFVQSAQEKRGLFILKFIRKSA